MKIGRYINNLIINTFHRFKKHLFIGIGAALGIALLYSFIGKEFLILALIGIGAGVVYFKRF